MGEIVMPRLSDTMEEGTILRWLKREGEHVARGEELVELETDKANMTYESDLEGTLQIIVPEGATLPVGAAIAHVGGVPLEAAPVTDSSAGDGPAPPGPGGVEQAAAKTDAAGHDAQEDRVRASPLARRIAGERGLDLHGISGSGPGGRIVRADVEAQAGAGARAAGADAVTAAPAAIAPTATRAEAVATAKGETTVLELTRTQQTIARRMAESKATIPDFSIQIDVEMDACVALREQLKGLARAPEGGVAAAEAVPTYNDMIVKACALALREHPRVNSSYRDGQLQLHSRVNVGVAVAAAGALVVPTVFDADTKALGEVARETRTLAARVRSGEITPPELGGGTFTVSNLGMYGVASFTAIINPPQVAIVSVGALARRAVAGDDGVAVRSVLTLTLVCDHRVLYGADAAEFAARVRELLQAPASLTL